MSLPYAGFWVSRACEGFCARGVGLRARLAVVPLTCVQCLRYRVPMLDSWGRARRIELLGSIPLFSACSQRELSQVAALTVPAELKKGTVLTRQGAAGGLAFIIAKGRAEVTRNGKPLAKLGPGDVVGELSLIDGKPRSATVTALSDVEVLELDGRDLAKLMKKVPSVVRKLLESLSQRLRDVDALPTSA